MASCGECNKNFQNKEQMVKHVVLFHDSEFDLDEPSHETYRKVQENLLKDPEVQRTKELLRNLR